jgi:hypothetical protein
MVEGAHPHPAGGTVLASHVDLGGRVVADQDGGQAPLPAAGGQPRITSSFSPSRLRREGVGGRAKPRTTSCELLHLCRSTSRIIEITVLTAPVLYPSGITMSA